MIFVFGILVVTVFGYVPFGQVHPAQGRPGGTLNNIRLSGKVK